jgi:hypothetical protein
MGASRFELFENVLHHAPRFEIGRPATAAGNSYHAAARAQMRRRPRGPARALPPGSPARSRVAEPGRSA